MKNGKKQKSINNDMSKAKEKGKIFFEDIKRKTNNYIGQSKRRIG